MQAKKAVERQRALRLARRAERELPAQVAVVAIAVRGHRREPVERAAQDHQHEARAARAGRGAREGEPRGDDRACGGERSGTEEFAAFHG